MQVKNTIPIQQASLAKMVDEIKACRLCEKQLALGPNPIVQLSVNAKILIASQAPGSVAHASGIPFLDKSGERLREWMGLDELAFYDPNNVAILPMAFCYPGRASSGDLPPSKECAAMWRSKVLGHLPNVLLTLLVGQYSQRWHLSDNPYATLTETVMNWRTFGPSVMPLPHPSPRNNVWLAKNPWFEEALVPILRKRVAATVTSV